METVALIWVAGEVNENWEFLNGGIVTVEQKLGSEQINKFKEQDCESHIQGSE